MISKINCDAVNDIRLRVSFDENQMPIVTDKKAIDKIDRRWSNGDRLFIRENVDEWEIVATRKMEMEGMEEINPNTWRSYKDYFNGQIPMDIMNKIKGDMDAMDSENNEKEKNGGVINLVSDVAKNDSDVTDYSGKMSDDLKKIHEKNGLHIKMNKIDSTSAMIIVNTLIAALWSGIIYVVELFDINQILREIRVFKSEENAQKYIAQNKLAEDLNRYGRNGENAGDDKKPVFRIKKLFEKMGRDVDNAYKTYLDTWKFSVSETDGRTDIEDKMHARGLMEMYLPVINEDGMLVLCRDSYNNEILAYPIRNNLSGGFGYGIFRIGNDGNVSKSKFISSAEASSSSNKLMKFVKDAEGDFSSKSALEAAYRLWLWNLCKHFTCIHENLSDYSIAAIRKFLLEWIETSIDLKVSKNKQEQYIVFCECIRGDIKVGLWQDDLQYVFDMLNIDNIQPKKWIDEAAKSGWIQCAYASNGGTPTLRRSYNPSQALRQSYQRVNQSERVFLFNFDDETKKRLFEIRENANNDKTVDEEK